jgi:hypothetical protein
MNVLIRIDYIASRNKAYQTGCLPLRGKTPEKIALEWWRQINREMSYHADLEKVIANGEDITQLVKDLEDKELNDYLDLPF